MKAMWTKGPPPPELVDLALCETFHCLPSELADEDAETLSHYILFLDIRGKVSGMKWKKGAR